MKLSLKSLLNEPDCALHDLSSYSSLQGHLNQAYFPINKKSDWENLYSSPISSSSSSSRKNFMSISSLLSNENSSLTCGPNSQENIDLSIFSSSNSVKHKESRKSRLHKVQVTTRHRIPMIYKNKINKFEFVKVNFTPGGKPWSFHPKGGGGLQLAMIRRDLFGSPSPS